MSDTLFLTEATTANILIKISSTESNCIDFVRVLAIRVSVKAIVNFGVGGDGREGVVEVGREVIVRGVVILAL